MDDVELNNRIQAACLPPSKDATYPDVNVNAYIAGWGITKDAVNAYELQNTAVNAYELQNAAVNILEFKMCEPMTPEAKICLGSFAAGTCTGNIR
jgi:hypothetical protein